MIKRVERLTVLPQLSDKLIEIFYSVFPDVMLWGTTIKCNFQTSAKTDHFWQESPWPLTESGSRKNMTQLRFIPSQFNITFLPRTFSNIMYFHISFEWKGKPLDQLNFSSMNFTTTRKHPAIWRGKISFSPFNLHFLTLRDCQCHCNLV